MILIEVAIPPRLIPIMIPRLAAVLRTFRSQPAIGPAAGTRYSPNGTRPNIITTAATSNTAASLLLARKARNAAEATKKPSIENIVPWSASRAYV